MPVKLLRIPNRACHVSNVFGLQKIMPHMVNILKILLFFFSENCITTVLFVRIHIYIYMYTYFWNCCFTFVISILVENFQFCSYFARHYWIPRSQGIEVSDWMRKTLNRVWKGCWFSSIERRNKGNGSKNYLSGEMNGHKWLMHSRIGSFDRSWAHRWWPETWARPKEILVGFNFKIQPKSNPNLKPKLQRV